MKAILKKNTKTGNWKFQTSVSKTVQAYFHSLVLVRISLRQLRFFYSNQSCSTYGSCPLCSIIIFKYQQFSKDINTDSFCIRAGVFLHIIPWHLHNSTACCYWLKTAFVFDYRETAQSNSVEPFWPQQFQTEMFHIPPSIVQNTMELCSDWEPKSIFDISRFYWNWF